jgi:hypothetical protein
MAANASGFTEQVNLTKEKVPQQVDPQGTRPGEENPQVASVAVKAKAKNKGALFLGFSKVEVEEEGGEFKGFELSAGETVSMDIETIGRLWFNGANTGDGLCVLGVGP